MTNRDSVCECGHPWRLHYAENTPGASGACHGTAYKTVGSGDTGGANVTACKCRKFSECGRGKPDGEVSTPADRELARALEQACKDLQQAHNEILRAQGCSEDQWLNRDWPRWTPQANTIRWAEKLLGKPLGKRGAQP